MPLARLCALALVVLPIPAFAVDPQVTVIKAGVLIDGTGGTPIRNAVIVIEGERITAVGAGIAVPAGARVLDFSDRTVLPGFIDAHTHISAPLVSTPGWEEAQARETAVDTVLRGAFHARQTLEAGYTTIREVGARDFTDVSLRNAIRSGWIVGPRMQVAAHAIGITGGHCDRAAGSPTSSVTSPASRKGLQMDPTRFGAPSATRSSTAPISSRSARPVA